MNGTPSTVFTRALPNGSGTEFVFTLFLPSTAPDSAIAEQSDILSQELQLLKELCEPQGQPVSPRIVSTTEHVFDDRKCHAGPETRTGRESDHCASIQNR